MRFRSLVGDDNALRKVDAFIVKVWHDPAGRVHSVRALAPRIGGVFPRRKPWLFDESGRLLRRPHWLDDPRLLRLATEAAATLRIHPPRLNGLYRGGPSVFAIRVDLDALQRQDRDDGPSA